MYFTRCGCSSSETFRVSLADPAHVIIECVGCGQRVWIKREQRCTYEGQSASIREGWAAPNAVMCTGPASEIVHDKRGCRLVCPAHAVWRSRMSQAPGHSADCPETKR